MKTLKTIGCTLALAAATASGQTLELPPPPSAASQFDFLVGDWTWTGIWQLPSGEIQGNGTWSGRSALGGYGITDEWRILDGPGGEPIYLGASTRYFNPVANEWQLKFVNAATGEWSDQHAEWRDGEMNVWWSGETAGGQAFEMRVRYYDISRDGFKWQGDRSFDGGDTWIEGWLRMDIVRGR